MKNLLFFTFFITLLLAGCKKDKDATPETPQELFNGRWESYQRRLVEHANGVKTHEETTNEVFTIESDGNKFTVYQNRNKTDEGTFRIFERNGKDILELTSVFGKEEYELEKLTKSDMTWTYIEDLTSSGVNFKAQEWIDFKRK